jgi:hypothetical protein
MKSMILLELTTCFGLQPTQFSFRTRGNISKYQNMNSIKSHSFIKLNLIQLKCPESSQKEILNFTFQIFAIFIASSSLEDTVDVSIDQFFIPQRIFNVNVLQWQRFLLAESQRHQAHQKQSGKVLHFSFCANNSYLSMRNMSRKFQIETTNNIHTKLLCLRDRNLKWNIVLTGVGENKRLELVLLGQRRRLKCEELLLSWPFYIHAGLSRPLAPPLSRLFLFLFSFPPLFS